jgi:hypothetical protein
VQFFHPVEPRQGNDLANKRRSHPTLKNSSLREEGDQ